MLRLASLAVLLFVVACSGHSVVTTGSRVPLTRAELQSLPRFHIAVWSNHPDVASAIERIMRQSGHRVVDAAQLTNVARRQQVHFTPSPGGEIDMARISKLAGADLAVFSYVTAAPVETADGAAMHSALLPTAFQVSVSVKAVDLDTEVVRWSGTARFPQPVEELNQAAIFLSHLAVKRAACPVENGFEWKDTWPWNGTCRKRD